MLSARELQVSALPAAAQTWVNKHLYYTHGFGAVMTPVGAVGTEGRPAFVLQDIPPVGQPKIDQPRIYYGELTKDYVIVGTTQDEFDYAQEPHDVTTRFSGGRRHAVNAAWGRHVVSPPGGAPHQRPSPPRPGRPPAPGHAISA